MRKIFVLLLSILSGFHFVFAQNTFPTPTGNVGVGTTGTPSGLFQVQKGIGATIIGGTDYGNVIGSNGNGYELNIQGGIPTGSFGASGGALRLGAPARGDADVNVIQFLQNGIERMRIHNGGNIGIGVNNPLARFEIANSASGTLRAGITGNRANTNIQMAASSAVIADNSSTSAMTGAVAWDYYNNGTSPSYAGSLLIHNGTGVTGTQWGIAAANQGTLLFQNTANAVIATNGISNIFISPMGAVAATFLWNGNVGIGTTTPGPYKLAVEGTLGARKVKITTVTPWADYVFDNDYRLRTLAEIEKFIFENKHLPEVPSAAEVEKDGLDIGDNQAVLLKKIEELTLYMIDQNKKSELQSKTIAELTERIKQQEKDLSELKGLIRK